MKRLVAGLVLAAAAHASDDALARMLDEKAPVAQRNDACYALRGQRSERDIAAVGKAQADPVVRACAARNLREAGAVDALVEALGAIDADTKMASARELGAMRDARALEALGRAALDANVLVASSASDALAAYEAKAALPYLLRASGRPGVAGVTALERAARFHDAAVLPIARSILAQGDVAMQVIALGVIADLGDQSDLPRLREMAAKREKVESRGRGFGFMPAIDLGRAAQNAADKISAAGSQAGR